MYIWLGDGFGHPLFQAFLLISICSSHISYIYIYIKFIYIYIYYEWLYWHLRLSKATRPSGASRSLPWWPHLERQSTRSRSPAAAVRDWSNHWFKQLQSPTQLEVQGGSITGSRRFKEVQQWFLLVPSSSYRNPISSELIDLCRKRFSISPDWGQSGAKVWSHKRSLNSSSIYRQKRRELMRNIRSSRRTPVPPCTCHCCPMARQMMWWCQTVRRAPASGCSTVSQSPNRFFLHMIALKVENLTLHGFA